MSNPARDEYERLWREDLAKRAPLTSLGMGLLAPLFRPFACVPVTVHELGTVAHWYANADDPRFWIHNQREA